MLRSFALLCLALIFTRPILTHGAENDSESLHPLIAKVQPSVVTIRVRGRDGDEFGIGTGFIIDPEGLIATNFHVIEEGRPFSIRSSDGEPLNVLAIEASDVNQDLAIIRVAPSDSNFIALPIAVDEPAEQGTRVLAFGNPLGLEKSVVEGIVSAKRKVEGREMLQLAMPIERGNSGGPLVDLKGRVQGIVNMKSAVDQNLGFAIPIDQLTALQRKPNPVAYERWVQLGEINELEWQPLFGARWSERGGRISVSGMGRGFGGRSLLLSRKPAPNVPFEIGVTVRLDDESGAAGLAFHSDSEHKHYGFYPSAGRMRLTCFMGPSVYTWDVLHEVETDHYLPNQWNDLKVRVEKDRLKCYVNGHLVIESTDSQLSKGAVGLTKFRGTEPQFRHFRVAAELPDQELTEAADSLLQQIGDATFDLDDIGSSEIASLGESGDLAARELVRQAREMEQRAGRIRNLANDVQRANSIRELRQLDQIENGQRLLRGTLLIASLDYPDLDLGAYIGRIEAMSTEILASIDDEASAVDRREALDRYLFQENGYHGSRSEYYHPANSHLNRVIDDREGLPITLSVLYMELGRRIGIEVEGVGLPGHFVARHVISESESQLIDVFERGNLMSDVDARNRVRIHAGRNLIESDTEARTTLEILTRMLNNLIGIAGRNEDAEAMLRYSDAMVALNPEIPEMRLMRAQLRGATNRDTAAIEDLDWLLINQPAGINREAIRRLRASLVKRTTERN